MYSIHVNIKIDNNKLKLYSLYNTRSISVFHVLINHPDILQCNTTIFWNIKLKYQK